ncbi:secretin N-terminal domain-containing protein [Paludibacterium paludis]|uniref:Type IVB pilus formation outer membrane protein, R64 PilN family n=1 Tax=Paludibacterium paludis TaxID=1225769 RepID=A0A918UB48_9NEIS|nr:secretin N-terminal domain-containing protein [Paludibacterium paludis]GGY20808.1 type IVB pilus formation outer membrane protein, R64 PilN family [Paludibacterium paludis]
MKYSLAGASLIAAVLSGCAAPGLQQRIDQNTRTAEGLMQGQASKVDASTLLGGMVSVKNGLFLDDHQSTRRPARIPALENRVEFNRSFSSLQSVADRVTQLTGIAVRLAPEVENSADAAPALPMVATISAGSALPAPNGAMPAGDGGYSINFSGPLSQFLDDVAAHYHAAWDYDGRQISFYKLKTRAFDISALPFQDSVSLNMDLTPATTDTDGSTGGTGSSSTSSGSSGSSNSSSSSSTSGSSGTTDSTTGSTAKMDINKELMDTVKLMLSPSGKASLSPSTSELTVTDTPEALDRVGKLITALNNKLTRQAMFNVRVYSVETDREDDLSVNLGALLKGRGLNVKLGGGGYSIGSTIAPPALTFSSGSASDNTAVFNALSTEGKTTLVTSATVVAMNNKPVPISVSHLIPYVSSVSSQISQGDNNTVILPQIQTAYANSGLTMQLMPSISNHRDLLLHLALNMSRVESIKSFDAKAVSTDTDNGKDKKNAGDGTANLGTTVSIPELTQRQLLQEVRLHSGETLLLTGLDQQTDNTSQNGVGTPGFPLPGGGHQYGTMRDVLVISITPVVM